MRHVALVLFTLGSCGSAAERATDSDARVDSRRDDRGPDRQFARSDGNAGDGPRRADARRDVRSADSRPRPDAAPAPPWITAQPFTCSQIYGCAQACANAYCPAWEATCQMNCFEACKGSGCAASRPKFVTLMVCFVMDCAKLCGGGWTAACTSCIQQHCSTELARCQQTAC